MAHAETKASGLVKTGGALGIASAFIGLAMFLAGMFGIHAVFMLSILPLGLGALAIVMTMVGCCGHTPTGEDETAPISAVFCGLFGVIFGAIGWYLWGGLAAATTAAAAAGAA